MVRSFKETGTVLIDAEPPGYVQEFQMEVLDAPVDVGKRRLVLVLGEPIGQAWFLGVVQPTPRDKSQDQYEGPRGCPPGEKGPQGVPGSAA